MVVSARDEVGKVPEVSRYVVLRHTVRNVESSREEEGGLQTNSTGRDRPVPHVEGLLTGPVLADDLAGESPTAESPGQGEAGG